ncbi:type I pullulanase [Caviibacter abscessus]|uniref:type I pullulanase n=1 Tax=Caviibacter abscessus TaxID=1766719 RepID=UPI00082A913F|nr:type I pullulanase [Caviibacter abscessus]
MRLGALYTTKKTIFKVWAPDADKVCLKDYTNNKIYEMKKQVNGVHYIKIEGNLAGVEYTYLAHFGDTVNEAVDPYAKAVTVNGERGVVINLKKTNPIHFKRMPSFTDPTDAVIYELHVRDFSIDKSSKIKNKGTFMGLIEKHGINYLKSLGITHLQLLPIFDYSKESVDETDIFEKYNWGYDPVNYNAVEGSYSRNPYIPENRIMELKKMIKKLHENDIRVIMDVVYNHVYDVKSHSFDKLNPNYAFRMNEDGKTYSNGTGCGNDVASEKKWIRKYIVDSVVYWAKEYKLDGFRFDLMGILDVTTMNEIRKELDKIDKGIIILGEGWDLNTTLPDDKKAKQSNAIQMERIAFFSDNFRDSIKGSTFETVGKGFISGSRKKNDDVIKSIKGGNGLYSYTGPEQVVQYVEAHDNYTMFDHLTKLNIKFIKRRHLIATSLVLTSQGVPFLHAGQEFFRTKQGVENSYKSSDEINKFDWNLAKQNKKYIKYVSDLISLRKSEKLFRMKTYDEIEKKLTVLEHKNNVLVYSLGSHKKYIIIANASTSKIKVNFNGEYNVIFNNFKQIEDDVRVRKSIDVTSLNFIILRKIK